MNRKHELVSLNLYALHYHIATKDGSINQFYYKLPAESTKMSINAQH